MPFHVVLVHPEIPQNAGNLIRLSANTGVFLHLVEPLGFEISDRRLRRAGLDYHEAARAAVHADLAAAMRACGGGRRFALAPDGAARYDEAAFTPGDIFLFGGESRGLPPAAREMAPAARRLYIPMRAGNRSMNLSNAVAVVVMEAWRQAGFAGAG